MLAIDDCSRAITILNRAWRAPTRTNCPCPAPEGMRPSDPFGTRSDSIRQPNGSGGLERCRPSPGPATCRPRGPLGVARIVRPRWCERPIGRHLRGSCKRAASRPRLARSRIEFQFPPRPGASGLKRASSEGLLYLPGYMLSPPRPRLSFVADPKRGAAGARSARGQLGRPVVGLTAEWPIKGLIELVLNFWKPYRCSWSPAARSTKSGDI